MINLEIFKLNKNIRKVEGVAETGDALLFSALNISESTIILINNLNAGIRLKSNLESIGYKVYILPEVERFTENIFHSSNDIFFERAMIISKLANESENIVVIGTSKSFFLNLPNKKMWNDSIIDITIGQVINRDFLLGELINNGYIRNYQVLNWGEFSVRGDILDVFVPGTKNPYRIEFFSDEIDGIRSFDVLSQKSYENLNNINVNPATEFFNNSNSYIFDICKNLVVFEKDICRRDFESIDEFDYSFIENKIDNNILEINRFISSTDDSCLYLNMRKIPEYRSKLNEFINDLIIRKKRGYKQYIIIDEKLNIIEDELKFNSINYSYDNYSDIVLVKANLLNGFIEEKNKIVIYTQKDIFGKRRYKRKSTNARENQSNIDSFYDLKVGDYVVHINHGIGKYIGISINDVEGVKREYIEIAYSGEDKLFIPTDKIDLIGKYIGSDLKNIKLSSLNSKSWETKLTKAKKSIEEMSKELIELYSKRKSIKGFSFSKDTSWQKDFELDFLYEETPDQLSSIAEIKKDMEDSSPMDRLLCGDVGFGKTEVALRAAFKAAMDSKQTVILVPTTVLAYQHYENILERFKNYPIKIEMLSRLRTDIEKKSIMKGLRTGEIDIVVGTHMLFSKDIKFFDLGLLIIDEEQRFGVKHKERIKLMKNNIDTLSMSATPIPRTLHMSMNKIRDISLITQAPNNRYPIQTYIASFDKELIDKAIIREITRSGQVYYVYNRVESIERVVFELRSRHPNISFDFIHGKMDRRNIEDIMIEFRTGEIDVLISTTIIETGMDIPNVNTIIIENAHMLGLSQLYQLRGRVGRSSRIAYAYLLYPKEKTLSSVAISRLESIKEFTDFGSGFKIAMRDLEIRGSGNILGSMQSGHFAKIGYDLYMKLLSKAFNDKDSIIEDLEVNVDLDINAYIPGEYIEDLNLKMQIYKRIEKIKTEEDRMEIEDELYDRFGDIPPELNSLIDISLIKEYATIIGVKNIKMTDKGMKLYFSEHRTPEAYWFQEVSKIYQKEIIFHLRNKPYLLIKSKENVNIDYYMGIIRDMAKKSI